MSYSSLNRRTLFKPGKITKCSYKWHSVFDITMKISLATTTAWTIHIDLFRSSIVPPCLWMCNANLTCWLAFINTVTSWCFHCRECLSSFTNNTRSSQFPATTVINLNQRTIAWGHVTSHIGSRRIEWYHYICHLPLLKHGIFALAIHRTKSGFFFSVGRKFFWYYNICFISVNFMKNRTVAWNLILFISKKKSNFSSILPLHLFGDLQIKIYKFIKRLNYSNERYVFTGEKSRK